MEVGEEGDYVYLSLHCHHQNDSCIRMGSDESHFNISLTVRDKVTIRQCPQPQPFWREWRAKAVSNRGPSAYQPNALPLGQTGLLGSRLSLIVLVEIKLWSLWTFSSTNSNKLTVNAASQGTLLSTTAWGPSTTTPTAAGCGSPGPRSRTICGKTVWWGAATPRRLAARLRCRKRTSSSLTDATKWTDTFVKCRWASQLLEHLTAVIVRSLPTTSIFSYLLHRCSRNFCVDVLPTTSMFS